MAAGVVLLVGCNQNNPDTGDVSLSPTSLTFAASGASAQTVTVTASGSWTSSASADWIQVNPSSGNGNGSVSVSVSDNTSDARAGKVYVKSGSVSKEVFVSQAAGNSSSEEVAIVPNPAAFDGNKRASTTYQMLIYSFADSNEGGTGVGDFQGIINKLDYLDALGVTGIWLSPAQDSDQYHGYNVNDYASLNPLYGSEDDFKALIDAAHARGIEIYMDYVLNHSGALHEWFKSVKADPSGSPYRDYYVLSKDPTADMASGKIDNFAGATEPGMGGWHSLGDGSIGYKGRLHFKVDWTGDTKYVTVTTTTEAPQSPKTSGAERWIHIGSRGSLGMYKTAEGIYELTLDVDTDWGFLVRTSNSDQWPAGTKYGGKVGKSVITLGQPFPLDNSTAADIVFGETTYYFASFDGSMPDLNYGPYTSCENSPVFQSIALSADKWINMGVDGLRLDAVVWLYQKQLEANQRFLDQWYKRCNATYQTLHPGKNIFMVGEAWDGNHSNPEQFYYKGLPSNFEFDYGYRVRDMLNNESASGFASTVAGYVKDHLTQRSDAITSLFLSNHDEDRFASDLGRGVAKEKQAGAILLSSPGKPFIYQGEELGYWGKKVAYYDEPVRAPILWDKAGRECAKKGVNDYVDAAMLTAAISVEAQEADANSILNVYKTWSQLRNTYPALAMGEMTAVNLGESGKVTAWYMTYGMQKLLVVHNVASSTKTVTVSDNMSKPIALLGSGTITGRKLKLDGNSSVVFEL